jgi:hypothetical protein
MGTTVDEYIQKQKFPQKEICQRLRRIILKTVPEIHEKMYGGVPCYSSTKEDPFGKYYIAALKDHVNLGFSLKGLSKTEQKLFEGSGKTMKHIKVSSVNEIDEKKIIALLKLVQEK